LRDIDDIRNSLKQIGNDEMWFKWIELFGKHIQNSRDISKQFKKELLNVILESIIVDYNHDEKVHKLQINFKIPVHIINSNGEHTLSPLILSVVPPKAGRKSKDQNCTFPNYSTVTKCFPTDIHSNLMKSAGYSLKVSVLVVSSNLWTSPYSPAQFKLYNIISKLHDKDGWDFKQISDWLIERNFKTPRGKDFSHTHAWSIYKKKNISIERFSRDFEDTITDIHIDTVDNIPDAINGV
jgi:hypothetical protein